MNKDLNKMRKIKMFLNELNAWNDILLQEMYRSDLKEI